MCGISGIWQCERIQTESEQATYAEAMANALRHRGPDDTGTWVDNTAGLTLSHRRLSIMDLSPAGHQPMHSSSERFIISFNGEIYNHLELRTELEMVGHAPPWKGHSDTETLLAAIEQWGLEASMQRCVGMFAIALWDRSTQTLQLARDRFGEKPLYYGWAGSGPHSSFLFGSELKALRAYPGFDPPICRQALSQYLRFMYVPAPRSIYQGVYKLEPGCLLTIVGSPPADPPSQPLRPGQTHGSLNIERWMSLAALVEKSVQNPIYGETEALQQLEDQLLSTVRLQSLSDVPLGAFLSGGVDSSTIVALMQLQASRPVQTFTIGFDEVGYDESPHAKAVAQHLGTDHHEMRVTSQLARDVIPLLPHMFDEPFADSSQIPTYLVSQSARQKVTVALSGDAGDELFGGYNRYTWAPYIWSKFSITPHSLRKFIGTALSVIPNHTWDTLGRISKLDRYSIGLVHVGDKMEKMIYKLITVKNIDDFNKSLVSNWHDPSLILKTTSSHDDISDFDSSEDFIEMTNLTNYQQRMMFRDTMTYLPDDILCKVDRAAMACSLETRVPFLDHRVVELAWRLPLHMKIRGHIGKWALRQVLYKHVPKELIERPKAGFGIPVGQWLRGPLREWAESLLDPKRLASDGYFNPDPIRKVWSEHLTGKRDHTHKLWAILMFQAWLEQQNFHG